MVFREACISLAQGHWTIALETSAAANENYRFGQFSFLYEVSLYLG
jgi:hypothetical protein